MLFPEDYPQPLLPEPNVPTGNNPSHAVKEYHPPTLIKLSLEKKVVDNAIKWQLLHTKLMLIHHCGIRGCECCFKNIEDFYVFCVKLAEE